MKIIDLGWPWRPVRAIVAKRCDIAPRLLLISNTRKSHTPFQMRWKSSTLNDLEGQYCNRNWRIGCSASSLATVEFLVYTLQCHICNCKIHQGVASLYPCRSMLSSSLVKRVFGNTDDWRLEQAERQTTLLWRDSGGTSPYCTGPVGSLFNGIYSPQLLEQISQHSLSSFSLLFLFSSPFFLSFLEAFFPNSSYTATGETVWHLTAWIYRGLTPSPSSRRRKNSSGL